MRLFLTYPYMFLAPFNVFILLYTGLIRGEREYSPAAFTEAVRTKIASQ